MKTLLNILLIYSILMAALGISYDTVNILQYGSIDLRNRVVGARVSLDNKDPYFFKWNKKTPEYYVDARDYYSNIPVSRLTVTPAVLLLHLPFASIEYKTQQILWAILQWLLLLITIFLFSDIAKSDMKKKIIWIIGLLIIASSYFWRLHVERGQIYILYVFIYVLSYWFAINKKNYFISGFLLGVNSAFRPVFLLSLIPMLINKRVKIIYSSILGLVTTFAISVFCFMPKIWISYLKALPYHEKFHLGNIIPVISSYPKSIVDGIKRRIFDVADIALENSSIQGLMRDYANLKIKADILELALLITIIILVSLLWNRIKKTNDITFLFYIGISFVILAGFFLPAARISYMNVYWLLPLSFIAIKTSDINYLIRPELLLLIAGLLLNTMFKIFLKSILISDYLILFYIIITLFNRVFIRRDYGKKQIYQ